MHIRHRCDCSSFGFVRTYKLGDMLICSRCQKSSGLKEVKVFTRKEKDRQANNSRVSRES